MHSLLIFVAVVLSLSKLLFPPSRLTVHPAYGGVRRRLVTLQRFITLIAPEAPKALVPGAPEPSAADNFLVITKLQISIRTDQS